jgi:hypothetical protein
MNLVWLFYLSFPIAFSFDSPLFYLDETMPTHTEVNTLPTTNSMSTETGTVTYLNTPVAAPPPPPPPPPPVVHTRIRGQVLTVLITKGHYRLRTITPRDCSEQPNFLLDITQEAYNIISNERDHILGKYFRQCRSDYSFGYKLDNHRVDDLASVSTSATKRPGLVRFYNCALTPATVEGLREPSDQKVSRVLFTRHYIQQVGDYLMFHIIHWQPKSLANAESSVPLYRYKFIEGRFFKSVQEWELFLYQQQSMRNQQEQACDVNSDTQWSIGQIEE